MDAIVRHLVVARRDSSASSLDVVYTGEETEHKSRISAHLLRTEADASKTESKTVLSSSNSITQFKFVEDGKIIVAASRHRLMVGVTEGDQGDSLKDFRCIWRELVSPTPITCLDVRVSSENPITATRARPKQSKRSGGRDSVVDVVTGDTGGILLVHENLLQNLKRQEAQPDNTALARAPLRRMHWHREAIHTVKWSLDGMSLGNSFID